MQLPHPLLCYQAMWNRNHTCCKSRAKASLELLAAHDASVLQIKDLPMALTACQLAPAIQKLPFSQRPCLEGFQQRILGGWRPIVAFEEADEALDLIASGCFNTPDFLKRNRRHEPPFSAPCILVQGASKPTCGTGLSISASSFDAQTFL